MRDGEVELTYEALGERADEVARALIASGIDAGDRVGIWAPNCWQWVVAALGILRAGAVLVPVNTRSKAGEAGYVLAKAGVRALFVVDGFLDTAYSTSLDTEDLPALATIVDLGRPEPGDGATDPVGAAREVVGFGTFTARGNDAASADPRRSTTLQAIVEERSSAVGPDDVAAIMFTSGTTGHPKGVLVRGGAIIRAFWGWSEALGVERGDPYLLVNPYFHAFGFNSGIVVCLLRGAVNLPVAVFDVDEVLATIERERVTVFPGPPAIFQSLLNHADLDRYDISSLRATLTGAASISVELVEAMRERLGFSTVVTAYGMTETSGIAAHTRPEDPPDLVAATSGRAIDDVELRVVGADGVEVPRGEAGELLVRGYQVTPGYLDEPEQTAEAIDGDGWLHTGDVAVMDEAGYIDITDRTKDMFIIGGFNAYPAEIERQLVEHPGVGIAAVIGVPDQRMGEVGAAFVVRSPDAVETLTGDELIAWARQRMANYKVPRHVWFVEDLPLTASNKVRKPDLRASAVERLAGAGGATSSRA